MQKPKWVQDNEQTECKRCEQPFTIVRRRHHCRSCGALFCEQCSTHTASLPADWGYSSPQRVCDACYAPHVPKERALADAILTAQYYVRANPTYQYDKPIPSMGRSIEKYYVMTRNPTTKTDCVLTLLPTANAPWSLSSDTQRSYFINTLLALKHPNVLPVLAVDVMKENEKVALVRSYCQKGSLRDYIYKTKPQNPHEKKYLPGAKKQTLDLKLITKWGKQVFEGMLYLYAQGLPVTFAHSGNIIIDGDNCCVSEVENTLLGIQISSPHPETPQLALASILHEMGTGTPLTPTATVISTDAAVMLPGPVTDTIKALIAAAYATPVPAFETVANLPFFSGVNSNQAKLDKKMLAYIKKFAGKIRADFEEANLKARILKQQSSSSLFDSPPASTASSSTGSTLRTSATNQTPSKPAPAAAPTTTPTTAPPAAAAAPPPPPPAAKKAPPPPPPAAAAPNMPAAQNGRASLLDSIRNPNNMKKLKKVS